MQFMDPSRTQCEFCQTEANYSVKDLLAYKAKCQQCGEILKHSANKMHRTLKEHKVETWPMHFIFDGLEVFEVDIDALTDAQFDAIKTIQDFVQLVKKTNGKDVTKEIQSMKKIQSILNKIELNKLLQYPLKDLALIANED